MATLEINNPTDNNNGSLPRFIYNTRFDKQTKKDAYSTLIFAIQWLDGSHDPVFPISEIILTNSAGQTVLLISRKSEMYRRFQQE